MKRALQRVREADPRGLTRSVCARGIGVHPHTWKRWELGILRPTRANLEAAAEYLGVPVAAIDDWPAPVAA
jgi:transcriptional regulator with XRE-family HTH domain